MLTYVFGVTEHGGRAPSQTPEVVLAERRNLVSWEVDDVLIGPMPNEQKAVSLMDQLLGRKPVNEGGVHLWVAVDRYPVVEQAASKS